MTEVLWSVYTGTGLLMSQEWREAALIIEFAQKKKAFISPQCSKPQQTVKTMNTVRRDNLIKVTYETSVLCPPSYGSVSF